MPVQQRWYSLKRFGHAAILPACLVFTIMASGCGSGEEATEATAESRFEDAKWLYDEGAFLDAINDFTVITLQFQGSPYAADAQFYLGECRFERGEYLLAAFEYGVLRRNYPASSRVPDALYKLGLSYYNMSPKWSLDQRYTRKAIDEFQTFVEYYPTHQLAVQAEETIKELNTRLAKKEYETARLYTRMGYYRAALISYDVVIEKYHDTEYAPQAFLDKAEILVQRGLYEEARTAVDAFLSRYPNHDLLPWVERLKDEIEDELREASPEGTGEAAGARFPGGGFVGPQHGERG